MGRLYDRFGWRGGGDANGAVVLEYPSGRSGLTMHLVGGDKGVRCVAYCEGVQVVVGKLGKAGGATVVRKRLTPAMKSGGSCT